MNKWYALSQGTGTCIGKKAMKASYIKMDFHVHTIKVMVSHGTTKSPNLPLNWPIELYDN